MNSTTTTITSRADDPILQMPRFDLPWGDDPRGEDDHTPHTAREASRAQGEPETPRERELRQALRESFPASDPIGFY